MNFTTIRKIEKKFLNNEHTHLPDLAFYILFSNKKNLGEMTDSSAGAGKKFKMSLEHPTVQESKGCSQTKRMGACQTHTGTDLEEHPMAKLEQFEQHHKQYM